MTRQALAQDRGLQTERTALAWNRTVLAIAASGVLVVLRNGDTFTSGHHTARMTVVAAVAALAAVVCGLGAHRRRQLAHGHYSAMHHLPAVGLAVVVEGALILMYLMLPV
ncbi:MAG: DUF202 domain-containing protein [Mycobacterium sp.]|nr:DUF202 domain-containing protein [Mycobacterium sp.]